MVQGARYGLPHAHQHRFAGVSRRIDLADHATGMIGPRAEFQPPVTGRFNTVANTFREARSDVTIFQKDIARWNDENSHS